MAGTTQKKDKTKDPETQAAGGALAAAEEVTIPTEELERKYRFDALLERLGPPEADLAEVIFEEVTEARLVDMGVSIDSEKLLKDVPIFVGSSLDILASLSPAQHELVHLDEMLFPLLMDEARTLRQVNEDYEAEHRARVASKAERETAARRGMQAALGARNNLVAALRNALGEARQAKLDELASGSAEDAQALADSIEQVTKFALGLLASGTPGEKRRLAIYKVTRERVEAVRAMAAEVREGEVEKAPRGERVSQRRLDYQDGRVLWLVDRVLRAFRYARRQDPTILLPELRYVARFFDLRRSRKPREDAGGSDPPAGGTGTKGRKGKEKGKEKAKGGSGSGEPGAGGAP